MSYVEKTLVADEKIVYYTHPHWAIFYTIIIWLALAVFMFLIVSNNFLGIFFIAATIFSFINSLIEYYFSEYAITSRRVVMKAGFIKRRSLELFLERVEGVLVDQTIFGRILNFGTVIIIGVGGTKNCFFFIPQPLKFRNELQHHLDAKSDSGK